MRSHGVIYDGTCVVPYSHRCSLRRQQLHACGRHPLNLGWLRPGCGILPADWPPEFCVTLLLRPPLATRASGQDFNRILVKHQNRLSSGQPLASRLKALESNRNPAREPAMLLTSLGRSLFTGLLGPIRGGARLPGPHYFFPGRLPLARNPPVIPRGWSRFPGSHTPSVFPGDGLPPSQDISPQEFRRKHVTTNSFKTTAEGCQVISRAIIHVLKGTVRVWGPGLSRAIKFQVLHLGPSPTASWLTRRLRSDLAFAREAGHLLE